MEIRRAAVQQITDETVLLNIFKKEGNEVVRRVIKEKITDKKALKEIEEIEEEQRKIEEEQRKIEVFHTFFHKI